MQADVHISLSDNTWQRVLWFSRTGILANVLFDAKLQFLSLHLFDLFIVEFVPVSSKSVLHVSYVVSRIGADSPVDQHCTQLIDTFLVWGETTAAESVILQVHQLNRYVVEGYYFLRKYLKSGRLWMYLHEDPFAPFMTEFTELSHPSCSNAKFHNKLIDGQLK